MYNIGKKIIISVKCEQDGINYMCPCRVSDGYNLRDTENLKNLLDKFLDIIKNKNEISKTHQPESQ